ncbi:hypothetical protein AB0K51_32880 [Kitasatospora sp. NPDC049285]|uniref:hypothetical protein n=1 Tax=Kitasatospora sp. NPDC049285 TaxID=3157096 RepID=UPI00342BA48C
MPSPGEIRILVTFIDAADGQPFARSEMPAEQLPESFEAATRLAVGGAHWEVVAAEPVRQTAWLVTGRLELTLRRIEGIDPRLIGGTLPSICAELPPLEDPTLRSDDLVIHEDDWRQTELVSRRFRAEVEDQLDRIGAVFERSRVVGQGDRALRVFDELHLRTRPVRPVDAPLTVDRLYQLLTPTRMFSGVALRDGQGRVADSFAAEAGPVTVYGLHTVPGNLVTVLALAPTTASAADFPELADLMEQFDLLLIDWCSLRGEDPEA